MNKPKKILSTLWNRLPRIAFSTIAALIILMVAREAYRVVVPGSWYLSYKSFNVESVLIDEDIPYTVCRSRTGTYDLAGGARSIFKINDASKPDEEEIFATISYPGDGATTNRECVSSFINQIRGKRVIDLPAGNFTVTSLVKFKVNGLFGIRYDKEVETKSNLFKISDRPLTPQEIQNRIDELQRQIDDLKNRDIGTVTSPTPTGSNSTKSQTTNNSTPNITNNTTNNNTTTTVEPRQPGVVERLNVGVGNVLKGLFGD